MSHSPNEPLALETFLPYRLSVLSNRISNAIAADYSAQFDLTIPAWRVMAILGHSPNLSAAELVSATAMDKVAISRAVSTLMEKTYITRTTDAADRRRLVLSLTPEGISIYQKIVPLARRYEQDLIENLSENDVDKLHALIDTLLEKADHWNNHGLGQDASSDT